MSGDDAKEQRDAEPNDDPLGRAGDVSDEEADQLAADAEKWLDDEDQKDARAADENDEAPPLDEVDMRDILRRALHPPPGAVAPDLLQGVQKKLRARSRGKFYGDGWSTARSPRSTYLVTSVLMLVLIGFVFLILLPWGSGALP